MHIDQTQSNSHVNAGVLEAFRGHISIRRAEGAEADDLLREVQKWWVWDLPFAPSTEFPVSSASADEPGGGTVAAIGPRASIRVGPQRANAGRTP
jgi:hypothetical protein